MEGTAKNRRKRAESGYCFASFLTDDGVQHFNLFKEENEAKEWFRRNARFVVPGSATMCKIEPNRKDCQNDAPRFLDKAEDPRSHIRKRDARHLAM